MTTPSNTIEELVGRVEAATGPDRELDLLIAQTLVPDVVVLRRNDDDTGNEPHTYWEYTGSVDAALALAERVLPGWHWTVASLHTELGSAWADVASADWIDNKPGHDAEHAEAGAATPALAIILATLRSLPYQGRP